MGFLDFLKRGKEEAVEEAKPVLDMKPVNVDISSLEVTIKETDDSNVLDVSGILDVEFLGVIIMSNISEEFTPQELDTMLDELNLPPIGVFSEEQKPFYPETKETQTPQPQPQQESQAKIPQLHGPQLSPTQGPQISPPMASSRIW